MAKAIKSCSYILVHLPTSTSQIGKRCRNFGVHALSICHIQIHFLFPIESLNFIRPAQPFDLFFPVTFSSSLFPEAFFSPPSIACAIKRASFSPSPSSDLGCQGFSPIPFHSSTSGQKKETPAFFFLDLLGLFSQQLISAVFSPWRKGEVRPCKSTLHHIGEGRSDLSLVQILLLPNI